MELKRIITTRLDDFCNLLKHIYGERIVKSFTTRNENNDTLTMNSVANNQKVKKEYDRMEGEGCTICYNDFRNENFLKRNLEFPGWIGNLNFARTTPAKEIMIIGEAPTTLKSQKDQINIAFGLGLYPINSNGELDFEQLSKTYSGKQSRFEKIRSNQEQKNGMWKYINLLFSRKLDDIKDQIYITDLCKCNDDIKSKIKKERKNEKIWKLCRNNYLLEEIKLINPSLIIFQSWNPYKKIKEYFGEKYSREGITRNPHYGKFSFNGIQIPHFVIVHQSKIFGINKYEFDIDEYINRISQFIKNKILTEVLQIK